MPRPDQAPKPGDSRNPRITHESSMGVGPGNFQDVFGNHSHNGSAASGGLLYGPYFIFDSAGKAWKLVVSTTGALSTVKAH